jgi:hypothetical protein
VDPIRRGIGTIYIGVESFEEEILQREGLQKRDGDIRKWFDELHQNAISTLGFLIIGWDAQSRERILQETEQSVSLSPCTGLFSGIRIQFGTLLATIIAFPFLLGIYGIANLLYWIQPREVSPSIFVQIVGRCATGRYDLLRRGG